MSARERTALTVGYAAILVTLLGVLGIFTLGATTAAVGLFVAGLAGVIVATAALVQAEQNGQRPASRSG